MHNPQTIHIDTVNTSQFIILFLFSTGAQRDIHFHGTPNPWFSELLPK